MWRTKEDIDFILKEMKDFLRRAEEGEWPKDIRLVRDGSTIDCLQLMLGAIKKLGIYIIRFYFWVCVNNTGLLDEMSWFCM